LLENEGGMRFCRLTIDIIILLFISEHIRILLEVVYMEILTPKEASLLLKISEYTLLDYARKGKIPARKVANRWRFSKDELMEWFSAPTLDYLLKEAEQEYKEGKTKRLWPREQ
jgi:excisionase family DNA binding protein